MIGQDYTADTEEWCAEHAIARTECRCRVPGRAGRSLKQMLADADAKPAPDYSVPNVVPEGGVLLGAPSKAGKTTLILDWAWNVASGSMTMKAEVCEQGDVLVISPEMSDRLIASYLRRLYPTDEVPDRFEVLSAEDFEGQQVRHVVDEWLERVDRPKMVVLDTLEATLRQGQDPSAHVNQFSLDYKTLAGIHKFAEARHISMVVTHHTNQRRLEKGEPWEYALSGTSGLLASIGTFMLLRDEGNQHSADWRLHAKGRYYAEQDWSMRKHPVNGAWEMMP